MASKHTEKKNVLITGCTTGSIGHALALEFCSKGFRVIATSRNIATMPDLAKNGLIDTVQLDVCNHDSIIKAKAEIENLTGGRLEFLVNNAGGTANLTPAAEIDIERAKQDFELNFWGAVRMVEAFTPLLMRSSAGHIVNISTTASAIPVPYVSMYGAAKSALNYYGDVLRIELMPFNISVTTVITGATANSKNRDSSTSEEGALNLRPGSLYTSGAQAQKDAYQNGVGQGHKQILVHRRSVDSGMGRTGICPAVARRSLMYDMWGLKEVAEGQGKKRTRM
ncbi:unnamed protein product [Peniophora sp. CBMAI 1063]|nr:unnamed protein product [Peniophora sp. CBMAI 1063]